MLRADNNFYIQAMCVSGALSRAQIACDTCKCTRAGRMQRSCVPAPCDTSIPGIFTAHASAYPG